MENSLDIDDFKNNQERHDFFKLLSSELKTINGDPISPEKNSKRLC